MSLGIITATGTLELSNKKLNMGIPQPKKKINAKKKGNAGEHAFAHWLEDNGIKAFRNSMSGGSIWKGDIANNLDLTIEVKTVKKINLIKCWRQVSKDASMAHNSPLLAIHMDGMPQNNWLMVLDSNDWLELIKNNEQNIQRSN